METTRGELGTDLVPTAPVLIGGRSFWGPVDLMKFVRSRTDDTSARASRGAVDRIKGDFGLRGKGRSVALEPDGDAIPGEDMRSSWEVPADDVITFKPIFGSMGSGLSIVSGFSERTDAHRGESGSYAELVLKTPTYNETSRGRGRQ